MAGYLAMTAVTLLVLIVLPAELENANAGLVHARVGGSGSQVAAERARAPVTSVYAAVGVSR